ncbi:ADP-ribosylation factor-like protein [Candidatus Lokiarchaeum ossiferum]|uniref:ADP-ribosylation factor-like protein n=1 Tax=Candidatus Lokiarchaeum ossiferum TaxID=2951803 RepID=UPI00352C5520
MPIRKLPILGIAGGGKTSLILTLRREFKTLEKAIKPTKGIERSKLKFLDSDIVVWDFGGQEKYRESYKKKAETYFSGIEELFFVIDFQDQDAMTESMTFFGDIKESILEYSPDATINLLINKFDPGFEASEDHIKMYETLQKKFLELSQPLNIRIAKTSIFNPISVIRAFSKPIFQNTTLYDNFQLLFMEYINKGNGCDFIMIFTKNLMEIGNYFNPAINQQQMRDISHEIFKTFTEKQLNLSQISLQVKEITLYMIAFEIGEEPFYFTFGYDSTKILDASPLIMDSFNLLEDIKKLMNYF